MNEPVKPLILTKRWNHHTRSGGYDKLADFLAGEKIVTGKNRILRSSLAFRIWTHLVPSSKNVNQYSPVDFFTELKAISKIAFKDFNIIHALYAEDQFNFLMKFRKNMNSMLIGTFHLPYESEYIQKAISSKHIENFKKLDAAIVVSKSMVTDLEKWVGEKKVFDIPHGIDTNIFCPADPHQENPDSLTLLSVGDHGRDWETIFEVIRTLQAETVNINYHVVVPENKREEFNDLKQVTVHSNISEKSLIELYQKADVLLLPVVFGTANNTILESLACGTPVISTKVGGISEYVDEESGWLFEKGDTEGMIKLIRKMQKDSSLYLNKRNGARKKASSFDWKNIAVMVQHVYAETLKIRNF